MASTSREVIALLSSSPGFEIQRIRPRTPPLNFHKPRSSSPLLSPTSMLRSVSRKQRPESRCASIAPDAEIGVYNARTFPLQEEGKIEAPSRSLSNGGVKELLEATISTLKPVRKRTKKDTIDKESCIVKKPAAKATPKARAKKATKQSDDSTEVPDLLVELSEIPFMAAAKKPQKPRKPRQKKQGTEDGEMKPKKTRGKRASIAEVEPGVEDTIAAMIGNPSLAPRLETEENTIPNPATTRKRDWTPPLDTTRNREDEGHAGVEEHSDNDEANGREAFGDLQRSFGYNEQDGRSGPAVQRTKSGQAFKKKRRLDVVKPPKVKVKAAPKPRAPAKSSRTITAIVVAQYAANAPDQDPAAATTVSAFFTPQAVVIEAAKDEIRTAVDIVTEPQRRKRVAPGKAAGRKTKGRAKKDVEPIPKLLSPESALRRLDDQDILFGTSSQLVREESPAFIRELQQALDASVAAESTLSARHITRKMGANGSLTTVIRASGGLWSLATRDDDDELLSAEKRVPRPIVERLPSVPLEPALCVVEEPVELEIINRLPMKKLKLAPTKKASVPKLLVGPSCKSPERPALQVLPSNIKIAGHAPEDGVKSLEKLIAVRKSPVKSAPPLACPSTPKASHNGALLFKANSPTKRASPPKPHLVTPALPQTPRSTISFKDIDEIEDSEADITSSPPRRRSPATLIPLTLSPPRRRSASPTRPTPITTKPPRKGKATSNLASAAKIALFASSLQTTLFPLIARAITSAPRTKDPSRPSWHEKILLYDPIVLEDLCGWLNEGSLYGALRTEAERVALGDAVAMFEANGRAVFPALEMVGGGAGAGVENEGVAVNAKKKEKKKAPVKRAAKPKAKAKAKAQGKEAVNGDDDVDLIDVDADDDDDDEHNEDEIRDANDKHEWQLKPWMLQRWCEEHSVCCLWKEGLRGGVRARY